MDAKNILTLIGGLLGAVAPMLLASPSETVRLWGGVIGAISGVLLGQRGLMRPAAQEQNQAPPIQEALKVQIERKIAESPQFLEPQPWEDSRYPYPGEPVYQPSSTKAQRELEEARRQLEARRNAEWEEFKARTKAQQ